MLRNPRPSPAPWVLLEEHWEALELRMASAICLWWRHASWCHDLMCMGLGDAGAPVDHKKNALGILNLGVISSEFLTLDLRRVDNWAREQA